MCAAATSSQDPPNTEEQPCLNNTVERLSRLQTRNVAKSRALKPAIQLNHRDLESIDYSSNLDFTKAQDRMHSLATIKPDQHNITPHKINIEMIDPKGKHQANNSRPPVDKSKFKQEAKSKKAKKDKKKNKVNFQPGAVPLYEVWPGNNRFYFRGNLVLGPKSDRITNSIAWILILGVSVVHFVVSFPFLCRSNILAIPFLSIYLFISTIIFLLLTTLMDPGIIPRKAVWELNGEVPYPYNGGANKREDINASHSSNRAVTLDIGADKSMTKETDLKLCKICNIYKPPKAAHCNDCGNCVAVFDHHVPFVNNCIGKRNYRFYLGFLVSLVLLGLCYLAGFLIMIIAAVGGSGIDFDTDPKNIAFIVTIIVLLVLGIPSIVLFCASIVILFSHFGILARRSVYKAKDNNPQDEKANSVNWFSTDQKLFNFKQQINQEQLSKYLSSLSTEKPI